MDEKMILLWRHLHSTLTTTQIDRALRDAGLKHDDWMKFCAVMKGESGGSLCLS